MVGLLYSSIFFVACALILSGGLSLVFPRDVILWDRKLLAYIRLIGVCRLNSQITGERALSERILGLLCLFTGLMIFRFIPAEATWRRFDAITSPSAQPENALGQIRAIVDWVTV